MPEPGNYAKTEDVKKALSTERIVLLAIGASLAIFLIVAELMPAGAPKAPRGLKPGKVIPVDITLVTGDSRDLACSASFDVQGMRCAFDEEGRPWSEEALAKGVLAPYMTVGNVLYLIPDLWSEPALAARLAEEPPETVPRSEQKRFVASCQLTLHERVRDFHVRWVPTANWGHRANAWVGSVSNCSIR